jgi:hypothetical protein
MIPAKNIANPRFLQSEHNLAWPSSVIWLYLSSRVKIHLYTTAQI